MSGPSGGGAQIQVSWHSAQNVERCAVHERRIGHLKGVLHVGYRVARTSVDSLQQAVELLHGCHVCLNGRDIVAGVPDVQQAPRALGGEDANQPLDRLRQPCAPLVQRVLARQCGSGGRAGGESS
jgi:hypothetical protein